MRASATPPFRPPSRLERSLPPLVLIAVTLLVWHRALGLYFAQDDFGALARTVGLEPRLSTPWRYLSAQALFDLLSPFAGVSPVGYHAMSLLLHGLCAVLIVRILRRPVGVPAALIGAVFFVAHARLFTAVYWVSGIADPLSCLFVLLTFLAWRRMHGVRWLAVPLYALALLAKESAIPLPLALLAFSRGGSAQGPVDALRRLGRRMSDPVWLALAALAAAYLAFFFLADPMGAGHGSKAYALSLDSNMGRNLLTYVGWAANAWLPTVTRFTDAQDPSVWGWGLGALALWLLGLLSPTLRRQGWFAAGVWTLAFLAPYLPLASHTYHYYLYTPMVGVAVCVGIAADTLFARIGRRPVKARDLEAEFDEPRGSDPPPEWYAAIVLAALLAGNSVLLVRRIETAPFLAPGHYSDAVVDRASIARRLVESVRPALPPDSLVKLMVWILPAPEGRGEYFEHNLRSAVYDGLGLRVMLPQVTEVAFSREFRSLDDSWRWVLTRSTGDARVLEPVVLEDLIRQHGPPR